uniref:(northern house mosquito) hypothetical protein n=1 Tax=Culex pipiens TaxID=7175 RepID=A0A8D8DW67_CULPI
MVRQRVDVPRRRLNRRSVVDGPQNVTLLAVPVLDDFVHDAPAPLVAVKVQHGHDLARKPIVVAVRRGPPEVLLAVLVNLQLEPLLVQVVHVRRFRLVPEHVRVDVVRDPDGVVLHVWAVKNY